MSRVLVLLMPIDIVVLLVLVLTWSFDGVSTPPFISNGDDVIRNVTELVTI
jgi:hypothetical protein